MSLSDCLSLLGLIVSAALLSWGVLAWFLDKKFENEKEIESLKKSNQEDKNQEIIKLISELKIKMSEIDMFNNNSTIAVMKQFQSFELAIKDYQKEMAVITERVKQQHSEIEKLWKTVVTEIAPGVYRVSDKK